MNPLIGDRFLKRFIGRRLLRPTANPAGEILILREYTPEKPVEQDYPPSEDLPKKQSPLGNEKSGEINQS